VRDTEKPLPTPLSRTKPGEWSGRQERILKSEYYQNIRDFHHRFSFLGTLRLFSLCFRTRTDPKTKHHATRGEKSVRRGPGRLPCPLAHRTPPLRHQAGGKRSESGPTPPQPSGSFFWSLSLGFRSSNQLKRVRKWSICEHYCSYHSQGRVRRVHAP
jgi:hypothetical protein